MTKEQVLNILHEKNKRCYEAKATYRSARQALEDMQQSGGSAVSIQHLGALKDAAFKVYQSAQKDIEDFILSDWSEA